MARTSIGRASTCWWSIREYAGRIKVLLYNLRQGVDEDTGFRNAFGKSGAEIEAQVRSSTWPPATSKPRRLRSRPMAESDFPERPVSDADARLARADLLAGAHSAAEYQALLRDDVKMPEAEEGLGLLALRDHHDDDARAAFRGRHGGRQLQRPLLHRVRQAGTGQRKGRPGAAAKPRESIPSSMSRSP